MTMDVIESLDFHMMLGHEETKSYKVDERAKRRGIEQSIDDFWDCWRKTHCVGMELRRVSRGRIELDCRTEFWIWFFMVSGLRGLRVDIRDKT